MSVLIKLRDYRNLSAAENQVREYILKYPKKVLEYTVYELSLIHILLGWENGPELCRRTGPAASLNCILQYHAA